MSKLLIFGIAMFAFLSASWSGEFNHALYTQTTLQDIITEEQNHHSYDQAEAKTPADGNQLECRVSKYRVPCCYTNVQRPISEKKKTIIKLWMETLKIDPKLASLYQQEIQVTEGTRTHWIPIQEQLFPFINKELVKNDPVELFILLIGTIKSDFVFIATEFHKPISPAKNSIQVTTSTPELFVR